jgi:hypothetical protein
LYHHITAKAFLEDTAAGGRVRIILKTPSRLAWALHGTREVHFAVFAQNHGFSILSRFCHFFPVLLKQNGMSDPYIKREFDSRIKEAQVKAGYHRLPE